MARTLRLDRLEARDTPATLWADVEPYWAEGTFAAWTGSPDPGGVDWYVSGVELPDGVHNVLYAGDRGGARVIVVDLAGDKPILDRVFFDAETWRGGVKELTAIGDTLYVMPGDESQTPGPVYGKIDLSSGETSYHYIPGLDPAYRAGSSVTAVDIDWRPGHDQPAVSDKELIFLPGSTPTTKPGNVAFIVDPDTDTLIRQIGWGDPAERQQWAFAPAGDQTQIFGPDGTYLGVGMVLHAAGEQPDPSTRRVSRSVEVTYDGRVVIDRTVDPSVRVGDPLRPDLGVLSETVTVDGVVVPADAIGGPFVG